MKKVSIKEKGITFGITGIVLGIGIILAKIADIIILIFVLYNWIIEALLSSILV